MSKASSFFEHVIYKTLDNEINANVAQTYQYLMSFKSKNESFLKQKLKDYNIRKEYENILSVFTVERLSKDLDEFELKIFNDLCIKEGVNKFYKFIKEITTKENKDNDIKHWVKLVQNNISKLLKKQNRLILEVIKDIEYFENNSYTTDYKIDESTILNYKEYLNSNLNKDEE